MNVKGKAFPAGTAGQQDAVTDTWRLIKIVWLGSVLVNL
jgi:hypothetical protein